VGLGALGAIFAPSPKEKRDRDKMEFKGGGGDEVNISAHFAPKNAFDMV
jgi:hypothetical protein